MALLAWPSRGHCLGQSSSAPWSERYAWVRVIRQGTEKPND